MTWLHNFGPDLPVGLCGGAGRLESHVVASKLKSQVRLSLSRVRSPLGAGTGLRLVHLARRLPSLGWSLDLSQGGFLACSCIAKMARQAGTHCWEAVDIGCPFNSKTLSFAQARVGRHFSPTETWGFGVRVAALGPRLPSYPSDHYAPCPSQLPYAKP